LFLLVCVIAHSSASGTYWLFGVLTFLQMLFQACGIYLGMSLVVGSTRAIIAGIFVILLVVLATIATMTHEGAYSLIEVRFPGLSQEGKSDPDEHGGDKAPFSTLDSNESLAVRIDGLVSAYGLTNREAEVLTAAARGESNEKIANGMFVSIGTVKAHLYHIYKKMNIHTRKELYKALGISKKDR
ncbi:MAG: helix-turn-helix transcriptional regulator, partial [Coriobacteriales bacterium]|nr:helix-turn-helix transcriptional regulator [Coriobacteriales bacterium]